MHTLTLPRSRCAAHLHQWLPVSPVPTHRFGPSDACVILPLKRFMLGRRNAGQKQKEEESRQILWTGDSKCLHPTGRPEA